MPSTRSSTARAKAPAAKKSTSTRSGAAASDALALLENDHKEVRKLFKAYEKLAKDEAGSDERLEMAQQICEMLTVHAEIEEEIFYPAMRAALDADDLLDEAEVEHASAKELIAQIEAMDADDDLFDAKVKVLGEYVDHHVQEEENEMFPKARKAKLDLEELGTELQERKAEMMGEAQEEEG
ncbi:MAG TPA: hemerythrin domain-containing protein [Burkholderiaceae bacterium]